MQVAESPPVPALAESTWNYECTAFVKIFMKVITFFLDIDPLWFPPWFFKYVIKLAKWVMLVMIMALLKHPRLAAQYAYVFVRASLGSFLGAAAEVLSLRLQDLQSQTQVHVDKTSLASRLR